MKKVTIQEARILQLQMLKYVDKICRENNIDYSLAHGTLLGAIRHKGFIPWDDDIDILLYRKEYDNLLQILSNDQEYNLLTINTHKYYLPFAKICDKKTQLRESIYPIVEGMGVFIDIFPIDNLPNNYDECIVLHKRLRKINKMVRYSVPRVYRNSSYLWKRIIKTILLTPYAIYCRIIGTKELLNRINKLLQKYEDIETSNVGFLMSHYGIKELFTKNMFLEYIDVEFENGKFMAIKNYDLYLKKLYGNYMEYPPIEKRTPHHVNVAEWV